MDCIYIDPPYNTGARDWKYNNDYVDSGDAYRHSKWLAMMERRLKLAKKLLNPADSVLICTIDEKEYLRLGMLLEQVFTDATIQMVSISINPAAVARANEFGRVDEYAFFVMQGTGPEKLELNSEWITSKGRTHTGHARKDLFRRSGSNSERRHSPGCFYPIYIDKHHVVSIGSPVPPGANRDDYVENNGYTAVFPIRKNGSEGVWMGGVETANKLLEEGFLWIGRYAGERTPIYYYAAGERAKIQDGTYPYLGKDEYGVALIGDSESKGLFRSVPTTQWHITSHDSTQYGSRLLLSLMGGEKRFSYPKSLYAVEDTIRFFVANKPEALVLDFFAGSGTTAHAVMRLNHQDGGRRRCICVTNNEVSDAEERRFVKEGHRRGDPKWERLGICEYVTKPRIEAAITGLTPKGEPIKGDYKFTDEFPMADGFEENAVFFDLTYQDPDAVELGAAFDEVAPLLWLRAGARGSMVEHEEHGFAVADAYAVLFDYGYVRDFIEAVRATPGLSCVYIVTDDPARFASARAELGDVECVRLYESYLRSFRIAAEDAVR